MKKLKTRSKAPKAKPAPAASAPIPENEVLLKRVKIRSFSQCRAVASKILRELINGRIPPERVRYAIPLLQVIVSCNQSIYLRARLQRLQEVLNVDLSMPGEDPEEDESNADEETLESGETGTAVGNGMDLDEDDNDVSPR